MIPTELANLLKLKELIRKESGYWFLPVLQLVSFTVFAYIAAVVVVQGLRFLGVP